MEYSSPDCMMDVFNEQLVKIKNGAGITALKVLIILAAVAYTVLVPLLFPDNKIVMSLYGYGLLTIWVCIFVFWKRFKREYEYIFTNGALDFDKIFAKRSRKRIVSVNLDDTEVVAPVNSSSFVADMKALGSGKQYDCTSNSKDAFTCYLIANGRDGKVCVLFDPNKKILKAMKQYKPSLFVKFEL